MMQFHQSLKHKRRVFSSFAYASGSVILLMIAAPLCARTITLTAEDCDAMASISANAPRLSWAMSAGAGGIFNTQPMLYWDSKIAVLMRFPIQDIVPKGQRITKAELTMGPTYIAGTVNIQ